MYLSMCCQSILPIYHHHLFFPHTSFQSKQCQLLVDDNGLIPCVSHPWLPNSQSDENKMCIKESFRDAKDQRRHWKRIHSCGERKQMGFPYCSDQSISHSLEHSSENIRTEKEIFLPNREGTWVQVGHEIGWLTQDYSTIL